MTLQLGVTAKLAQLWERTLDTADRALALGTRYLDMQTATTPPLPTTPPPTPVPPVIVFPPKRNFYKTGDWATDMSQWTIACSPDSKEHPNVSDFADVTLVNYNVQSRGIPQLRRKNTVKAGQVGARLAFGENGRWDRMIALKDKDVEFLTTLIYPELLPVFYGDGSWSLAGWQFKNSGASGANAGLAMNIEVINGQMIPWLQGNNLQVIRKDGFPALTIGLDKPNLIRQIVHFSSDPDQGWSKLLMGSQELEMRGATMASNGWVGAMLGLYGDGYIGGTMLVPYVEINILG